MNLNIVSKSVPVTDGMRSYAEKKLQRVKKYFDDTLDVTVTFSVQRNIQTVEVLVHTRGLYLKGMERSEDLYASLDLAVDKIERQIARYKDRLVDRKFSDTDGTLKMSVYEATSVEESKPEIIVTKDIGVKPMSVEEAAMQMDLMNKQFFVFRNETGDISVIYKRDDGNIGLFA